MQRRGVGRSLDHIRLLGRLRVNAHDGGRVLRLEDVGLLEHPGHLELIPLGDLELLLQLDVGDGLLVRVRVRVRVGVRVGIGVRVGARVRVRDRVRARVGCW